MSRGPDALPNAVVTLSDEHRYMSLLLDTLAGQVQMPDPVATSDYYLLQDIVRYMHEYPDVAHHPTEDVMFTLLVKRDPSVKDDIERLLQDHARLSENTAELIELIDRAAEKKTASALAAARSAVERYVERLRAHMQFEETVIFPRATACLARRDWDSIDSHLIALEDPLFGPAVGSDYRVLYEYFSHRARDTSRRLTKRGFLQLDSFIMSADALEAGLADFIDLWRTHYSNIARESRQAAETPESWSPTAAIASKFRFGVFLTREVTQASGAAVNLYFRTLWNMTAPFFDKKK